MKRTFTLFIATIFVLTSNLYSQYVSSSQTIGSGANQLDITVSVDATMNQVKFEMTGPANVWFGFAFNTVDMSSGSYTILANVSGGNPAEYIMVTHAPPTLQPVQNLTNITSSTSGGRITYIFYRANSTGDPNDYVFSSTPGTLNIAWAYGTSLILDYHADRGSSTLNFVNPCATNPPVVLPTIQVCQGDSALIFGQYRAIAGDYYDTIPVSWGCDTIKVQTLIVNPPGVQIDTIPAHLCPGDSLNIGGTWISSPGNYLVYNSWSGCDSIFDAYIVTQTLIDTTVTTIGNSLNAVPGYSNYHWIDCNTGTTALGSTGSNVYTPMVVSTYRVEIIHEGCTLASGCHAAGSIGIPGLNEDPSSVKLHPNPASEFVSIEVNSFSATTISIYDLAGNSVYSKEIVDTKTITVPLSGFTSGVYLLKITGSETVISRKLIVRK